MENFSEASVPLKKDLAKENTMSYIVVAGSPNELYIATDSYNTRFRAWQYGRTIPDYPKIFHANKSIISCFGSTTFMENGIEKEVFDFFNCGEHYDENAFYNTVKYLKTLLRPQTKTGLILITSDSVKLSLFRVMISEEEISMSRFYNLEKFYSFGTIHVKDFKKVSETEIKDFLPKCVEANIVADKLISEPQIIGGNVQMSSIKRNGQITKLL